MTFLFELSAQNSGDIVLSPFLSLNAFEGNFVFCYNYYLHIGMQYFGSISLEPCLEDNET